MSIEQIKAFKCPDCDRWWETEWEALDCCDNNVYEETAWQCECGEIYPNKFEAQECCGPCDETTTKPNINRLTKDEDE